MTAFFGRATLATMADTRFKDWCLGCLKLVDDLLVIVTDVSVARTGYCTACARGRYATAAGKTSGPDVSGA
jgi:hypothetical protein